MITSTTNGKNLQYTGLSPALEQPCRCFSVGELQLATRNFDNEWCIGCGGFGKVYKGVIFDGPSSCFLAAVKRLHSMSAQGAPEFWVELKMLSRLRHCNLISLIGYCNDGKEMALVYEYMPHGTLLDHLNKKPTLLTWHQRLKICIGAARGLDYLHTGTGTLHGVIHRDVKSSNILLDRNYAAKISDFGLAKIGPINQPCTYVDTGVKGTFGYIDPNYFYTGKLTRKSDVYAFGVVLLEVLCGKPAVDRSLDVGLVPWAQDRIKQGKLTEIIDSSLRDHISKSSLKEFSHIASQCLRSYPTKRPTMSEVLSRLELALSLQERKYSSVNKTWLLRSLVSFEFKSWGFDNTIEAKEDKIWVLREEDGYYDPLPAVEKLEIRGSVSPGRILEVFGLYVNDAIHCTLQWVRTLSNGSSQYIEGAIHKQYTVVLADVGTYLSVEVVPTDDNDRKGSLFKCFANDGKMITMKTFSSLIFNNDENSLYNHDLSPPSCYSPNSLQNSYVNP